MPPINLHELEVLWIVMQITAGCYILFISNS